MHGWLGFGVWGVVRAGVRLRLLGTLFKTVGRMATDPIFCYNLYESCILHSVPSCSGLCLSVITRHTHTVCVVESPVRLRGLCGVVSGVGLTLLHRTATLETLTA